MTGEKDILDGLMDDAPKKQKKPKKQAGEPKKESVDQVKDPDMPISDMMATPQERFMSMLRDMGIRKGRETVTNLFFGGDIDDPLWLDNALKSNGISVANRGMIISAYYGETLDDLGIVLSPDKKNKKKQSAQRDDDEESDDEMKEIEKMRRDMWSDKKRKLALLQLESEMKKAGDELGATDTSNNVMKTIRRPVFVDGQPVVDGGGNIVMESVTEPVVSSGNSGMESVMTVLLTNLLNNKGGDSEVKAIVNEMKAENERARHETELQRKEDKIEQTEMRHLDELKRTHDDFKRELQHEREANLRNLEQLNSKFDNELRHRDDMDNIVGSLQATNKQKQEELEKRINTMSSDIKSTIVSKGTEIADNVTSKTGDLISEVVTPMAKMMGDQYKTQIDMYRQQVGLDPTPKATDADLIEFIEQHDNDGGE